MNGLAAQHAPVLVFDGECPRCTRRARLWWHLVSRDRYEIRPAAQLGLTLPQGRHGFAWLDRHGELWPGAGGLSEALAAGDPRVIGRLGDPRGRFWARALPVLGAVVAHEAPGA